MSVPSDYTVPDTLKPRLRSHLDTVNTLASMLAGELSALSDLTEEQAVNCTVHTLIYVAAHYAIQNAMDQGREPDPTRWAEVTAETLQQAMKDRAAYDQHKREETA